MGLNLYIGFLKNGKEQGGLLIPTCLIPPIPSPVTITIYISLSTPLSFGARSGSVKGHWVLWSVFLLCDEKGKHQGKCHLMSWDQQPLHRLSSPENRKGTDIKPSQEWSEHSGRTVSGSQRGRNEGLCYQQKLSVGRESAGILHYEKRINSAPQLYHPGV